MHATKVAVYPALFLFIATEFQKGNVRRSVKHGSFFHHMNITLSEAVKIIYFWSVGLTVKQIRREVGMSKECICDLQSFIREINGLVVIDNSEPLGGRDENGRRIIVEIDESKFGKVKYHKVSYTLWYLTFLSMFSRFFLSLADGNIGLFVAWNSYDLVMV